MLLPCNLRHFDEDPFFLSLPFWWSCDKRDMSEASLIVFSRDCDGRGPAMFPSTSFSWSKVGAVLTMAGVFTDFGINDDYSLKHISSLPQTLPCGLRAGTGGISSLAASSLALADKWDSEKLRNFSMLNRLVRAFSGCTGGDTGRSAGTVSVDSREAGTAYSLVGRGEVGGTRVCTLARGVRWSSEVWLESGLVVTRSSTLRRRSRGMTGMRNY